jgi:hypothetical protein
MPLADLVIASRAQSLGFVLGRPVVAGSRVFDGFAFVAHE